MRSILVLALAFPVFTSSQTPCVAEGCDAVRSVGACMKDQFARALGASTVGYAYAVHWKGAPIAVGGQGLARLAPEAIPMTADTRMQIASASKPITAVALLGALEERGRSPDEAVGPLLRAAFPDVTLSESVRALTVRHLLTHTSGFDFGYIASPRVANTQALVQEDVPHASGEYRYSNVNTSLARTLLEVLTGRDYEAYVREVLFEPVGAPGVTLVADSADVPLSYAFGGGLDSGRPLALDFRDDGGAYGWYATANDLVRFLHGVRTNAYLSEEATHAMLRAGMGWHERTTLGGPAYVHEGQWVFEGRRGVRSGVALLPGEVEGALLTATNGLFSVTGTLTAAYDACSVPVRSRLTRSGDRLIHAGVPYAADRVLWTVGEARPTASSPVYALGITVPASETVRLQGFWGDRPVTFVRTVGAEAE